MVPLAIAWGAVGLVALRGLLQLLGEALLYRRLVARAERPERFDKLVRHLGPPHGPIFGTLADGLQRSSTVDDALSRALVQAAQTPFGHHRGVHAVSVTFSVFAALSPAIAALVVAAETVMNAFGAAQQQTAQERYLGSAGTLDRTFVDLAEALVTTGWVLAALAVVWAARWWLLRPEIREARLVRALIRCASRFRPGAAAPVSVRLAELLAPETGLTRPAVATGLWLAAVTAGWLSLLGAAELQWATQGSQPFDVWPRDTQRRIEAFQDVVLPRAAAGSPIVKSERPSLTFTPTSVLFHNVSLLPLIDGQPPDGWPAALPPIQRSLADFPRPLEVMVLGHRQVPLPTVLSVALRLARAYDIEAYQLLVERSVSLTDRSPQAVLPLEFTEPPDGTLTVGIETDGVRVLPGESFVPFSSPQWPRSVSRAVRDGLRSSKVRDRIWLQVDRSLPASGENCVEQGSCLTYGQFIQVLNAADTSCPSADDCGLPGLGLSFNLGR